MFCAGLDKELEPLPQILPHLALGNGEALKGVKQYMFQDESQMALTHSWCESKWVVTYCYAQNCPSETLTVQ